MDPAARVSVINRYPVKSMQGERVGSVAVDHLGIVGDRRWAVRDLGTDKILSAKHPRDGRRLLACRARGVDADVVVDVDGSTTPVARSDELDERLSRYLGRPVQLASTPAADDVYESYWPAVDGAVLSDVTTDLPIALSTGTGTFVDLAALHVVTSASLAGMAELLPDGDVGVDRFRPSLVLEVDGPTGFVENDWPGRVARIGGATVRFTAPTPRCVMTTLAQPQLPDDKRILRTIAAHNRRDFEGLGPVACLGVYAEVVEAGTVTTGDDVAWT